jgi:hypothetical protein
VSGTDTCAWSPLTLHGIDLKILRMPNAPLVEFADRVALVDAFGACLTVEAHCLARVAGPCRATAEAASPALSERARRAEGAGVEPAEENEIRAPLRQTPHFAEAAARISIGPTLHFDRDGRA